MICCFVLVLNQYLYAVLNYVLSMRFFVVVVSGCYVNILHQAKKAKRKARR